ncbi:para-nitrobenzyl esterase [Sphingomonas jinjuensis]|uniref:Carboxylic ester hydrolase n=1 Tax=Sphingomonas jinjuensis TaxID=535907 RepID=A0A840FCU2_9SPHN|nr:para-nitrobenzyl esterase [Sphingomonas jinjuensis]
MTTRRSLLAGGLALTVASAARGQGGAARAMAPAGTFLGERQGGVSVFRGIRYGRAARFMAPIAEPAAREPVRALAFGPSCPQSGDAGGEGLSFAEDCLTLNVWTPEADARAARPVMVYIHGGAYSSGSANLERQDGVRLAEAGDVVVVSVNHRLNAFGYLYLARLDPRFADSGNAGQLDLILALKWVRDNIASFGGDPSRVMVFGQSGGGAKIATMMATPAAAGLFHRAATMSGQQVTASGPMNATARTRAYLAKLGVGEHDLAPLLAMPTERLVEALAATDPVLGGGVYFGPVLDMRSLQRHPFWPDAAPQSLGIPMMLGNTHDETRAFIAPDGPKVRGLSWDNLAEWIAPELRIDVLPEWVVAEYRLRFPQMTPTDVFYDATTCGRSWRGQVIEAEARARAGAPAWVYQVDFAARTEPARGAFHSIDIALVFGTLAAKGALTGTGADARAASAAMQAAFVSFARTGDPGAAWPRYDLDRRATMVFDVRTHVEDDPRRWQRELFARVPYIQPGT